MNQLINFFWTILGFAAVLVYWVSAGLSAWFYIFIVLSIIPAFLSQKIFAGLQLSNSTELYERLGVRFIRKFVQQGDIANRLVRKNDPAYQVIRIKANPEGYLKTIMMYERYHFICLIFFLLTSGMALVEGRYIQALIIMISNMFYNFYPILLQQYNRIRILRSSKKFKNPIS
ncbi:hypothetical protein ACFFGT_08565 [Mucilaginibacter angelicae]|uniref:Glycosyl-4,4'-diaponeurosporenoate acyltransferase n=1 Tax=Mucilaginibacter angelicae TaxID=869718 RepID=A0ABV6L458_9SPHI